MSSPRFAVTPAGFFTPKPTSFIAANGTAAKVVAEPLAAAAGVAATPTPDFYGGGTVIDLTATSTDSVSKDVILYVGTILTTHDSTATGDITTATQNTLNRVNGSWITDGFQVGDLVMVFAPSGAAQVVTGIDGLPLIVTGVTATALTFNGTPLAAGTNTLTAGSRIVAVADKSRVTVPANAGNSSAIPNARLLANPTFDASVVTTELKLGARNMLIAAMQSAVSALPAQVKLLPSLARY